MEEAPALDTSLSYNSREMNQLHSNNINGNKRNFVSYYITLLFYKFNLETLR